MDNHDLSDVAEVAIRPFVWLVRGIWFVIEVAWECVCYPFSGTARRAKAEEQRIRRRRTL